VCRGPICRESDAAIRASRMGSGQRDGLGKWGSNFVSVASWTAPLWQKLLDPNGLVPLVKQVSGYNSSS